MATKVGCIALVVMLTVTCGDRTLGPEDVAYVMVTPANWSPTALGDTMHFSAVATSLHGKEIAVPITWTSEPTDVVGVDADGAGFSRGAGSAQVRASFGEVSGTANVHVVQAIESVVFLTYFGNMVAVGDSIVLYADARDRNAFSVPGVKVSFQSLNPSIATVSLEGWLTGKSAGQVAVVATVAGKTDTAGFVIIP